jgi:hypothetical protein
MKVLRSGPGYNKEVPNKKSWNTEEELNVFYHSVGALQPPYSGPYQVLSRKDKTLKLLVRGKPITVSADRAKPAYILKEDDSRHTIPKPADTATPTESPPDIPTPPSAIKITRYGRHIHFPVCFTP